MTRRSHIGWICGGCWEFILEGLQGKKVYSTTDLEYNGIVTAVQWVRGCWGSVKRWDGFKVGKPSGGMVLAHLMCCFNGAQALEKSEIVNSGAGLKQVGYNWGQRWILVKPFWLVETKNPLITNIRCAVCVLKVISVLHAINNV